MVKYRFKKMLRTEGITNLIFYGDLVYKLRMVKGTADFVSLGLKIVKHLRRRKYDREDDMSYAWPFHNLVQIFPTWRDFSKRPQSRKDIEPRPLWLLVGTPSIFDQELASRLAEYNLLWGVVICFDMLFISPQTCV